MFSTCDPWAHCEHLVSGITMFSAFSHQVLRPLPPVSVFIRIEHSHDLHDPQTWPGHRVLYPEMVCRQQVDVIHEHEAVPLLAYAGTLELPLHGPPLPPVHTMTPATNN